MFNNLALSSFLARLLSTPTTEFACDSKFVKHTCSRTDLANSLKTCARVGGTRCLNGVALEEEEEAHRDVKAAVVTCEWWRKPWGPGSAGVGEKRSRSGTTLSGRALSLVPRCLGQRRPVCAHGRTSETTRRSQEARSHRRWSPGTHSSGLLFVFLWSCTALAALRVCCRFPLVRWCRFVLCAMLVRRLHVVCSVLGVSRVHRRIPFNIYSELKMVEREYLYLYKITTLANHTLIQIFV